MRVVDRRLQPVCKIGMEASEKVISLLANGDGQVEHWRGLSALCSNASLAVDSPLKFTPLYNRKPISLTVNSESPIQLGSHKIGRISQAFMIQGRGSYA